MSADFAKFAKMLLKSGNLNVHRNLKNKRIKNSAKDLEFRAVQKGADFIDLEKCCNMKIDLQKSASIRPRTIPLKRFKKWRIDLPPSPLGVELPKKYRSVSSELLRIISVRQ